MTRKICEFEVVSVSTVNIAVFWDVTPWFQVMHRNSEGASYHAMNLQNAAAQYTSIKGYGATYRKTSICIKMLPSDLLEIRNRRNYKTFCGKDDFMSTIFVYLIVSVFTVKLVLLRQINLFYLFILLAWCILKLCLDKLIIICFHNDL